jgi:hypothetical protein
MARNQSSSKRQARNVKEEENQPNQQGREQGDPSSAQDVVVQKATGLTDPKLTSNIIGIILKSLPGIEHASAAERKEKLATVITLLEQVGPRDATEGMLAGQMIACHEHALECLRNSQYKRLSQKARFENLKLATRLLEIYRKQFQALSKYREGRAFEDHQMMLEQQRFEDEKREKEEKEEKEREDRERQELFDKGLSEALEQASRQALSKIADDTTGELNE